MASKKAACVIGWPVEHSRSPLIHNYWIAKLGLDAEYRREAVPPAKFADFVTRLSEHGYVGANVTIPNKEAALALSQAESVAGSAHQLERTRLHTCEAVPGRTSCQKGFVCDLHCSDIVSAPPRWR